jgi:hypothetical protein
MKGGIKMKNCNEFKEDISSYIDKMLDEVSRVEFEKHIESCEDCGNEFHEISLLTDVCVNMIEVELPDNFKQDLHEKLTDIKKKNGIDLQLTFIRKKYFKIGASIAAVLILAVIIKGFFGFYPQKSSSLANVSFNVNSEVAKENSKGEEGTVGSGSYTQNSSQTDARYSSDASVENDNKAVSPAGLQTNGANKKIATTFSEPAGGSTDDTADTFTKAAMTSDVVAVDPAFTSNVKVLNKNTDITAFSYTPDKAVEKVEKYALAYSAIIIKPENTLRMAKSDDTFSIDSTKTTYELNLKIPKGSYDEFIKFLNDDEELSSIKIGTICITDVTSQMNDLNVQLNDLDKKINLLKDKNDTSSKQNKQDLTAKKEETQRKIKLLSDDTNYIYIFVKIERK